MKTATWIAIAATIFAASNATAAGSSLDKFRINSQEGLVLCRLSFQLAVARGGAEKGSRSDWLGCVETKLAAQSTLYKRTTGAMAKNSKAVVALKNYYAAWIATMRGIAPGDDETKFAYANRQSLQDQRITELWAAVEIESQ